MLTFGEKLKQARISKKLTQKQLSDKLDVSNTVISNWEKKHKSSRCRYFRGNVWYIGY